MTRPVPAAPEDGETKKAARPASWDVLARMNPLRGRTVGALGVTVISVVLVAFLCLRLTRWNATQAGRVVVAMPLGTVFRTLALVVLPAVFFALFLLGPWLAGTWVGARYVAVRREPDSPHRRAALRRYEVGVPIASAVVIVVVLMALAIGGNWRADRLTGYAAVSVVAFAGGLGTEFALGGLPRPWTAGELFRTVTASVSHLMGAFLGVTVLVGGVWLTTQPLFADPPGWLTWECMRITIPPDQPDAYRYADLTAGRAGEDIQVYVVGEQHGQLVILDERDRFVYLVHEDWVKADRFCKASR
jgi:hypothetical protein